MKAMMSGVNVKGPSKTISGRKIHGIANGVPGSGWRKRAIHVVWGASPRPWLQWISLADIAILYDASPDRDSIIVKLLHTMFAVDRDYCLDLSWRRYTRSESKNDFPSSFSTIAHRRDD